MRIRTLTITRYTSWNIKEKSVEPRINRAFVKIKPAAIRTLLFKSQPVFAPKLLLAFSNYSFSITKVT